MCAECGASTVFEISIVRTPEGGLACQCEGGGPPMDLLGSAIILREIADNLEERAESAPPRMHTSS